MPSDSITGAAAEYFSALVVPAVGAAVPAYTDSVPANRVGSAIVPPYAVVKDEGGSMIRDFEGNFFGYTAISVTITATTKATARAVGEHWLWLSLPPESRAGIEADTAMVPFLTGYVNPRAFLQEQPREKETETRRADQREFQYSFKLKIDVHGA